MSLYPDTHPTRSNIVMGLSKWVKAWQPGPSGAEPRSELDEILSQASRRLLKSWSSHALVELWMEVRTPGNQDSMALRVRAFARHVLQETAKAVQTSIRNIKDDGFRLRTTSLAPVRAHALWLDEQARERFFRALHQHARELVDARYPEEARAVPPPQPARDASQIHSVLTDHQGNAVVISTVLAAMRMIRADEVPNIYFFDAEHLAAAVAAAGVQDAEWVVFGLNRQGVRERQVHRLGAAQPMTLMGWGDWCGEPLLAKRPARDEHATVEVVPHAGPAPAG